jgi:ABC-2 type transport system ATP-binding protein
MADTIVAEKLVKRFGNFTAVDGVSFAVKEGEIFGFLGPNGAGKSTTINMLTTLLAPTAGNARIAGTDLVSNPEKVRERICLISQEGSVDGDLTAEENLTFYGKLYHVPKEELPGRVDRALKFVDLDEKRKIQVRFYSGGMKRRLEIAKVFVSHPKIIFLDEPTIGLDPQSRELIWAKIFEISRTEGATIFITTHYMQEAEGICNRIAIIDHGKIIALDTPTALRDSIGVGDIVEADFSHDGKIVKELEKAGFKVEPLSRNRYKVTTKRNGDAEKVAEVARKNRVKMTDVLVRRPTMEDVFLHYTGRAVREEKADGRGAFRALMRKARGG